jgi:hypothetical protein
MELRMPATIPDPVAAELNATSPENFTIDEPGVQMGWNVAAHDFPGWCYHTVYWCRLIARDNGGVWFETGDLLADKALAELVEGMIRKEESFTLDLEERHGRNMVRFGHPNMVAMVATSNRLGTIYSRLEEQAGT